MLNGKLLICVCLSGSLIASARSTGCLKETTGEMMDDFLRAPDLERASERFNVLFKRVGVEGLEQLRLNDHNNIALQAAWREVRLTLPEQKGNRRVRPDPAKLRWFLGFLEGRGRLRVPNWWQESILRAQTYRRDDCLNLALGNKPFYHDSGFGSIKTPLDTILIEEGASVVVAVADARTRVPWALLKRSRNLSALATSSRCYIATHGNFGARYPLICVSRDSGKLIWKARVWGHSFDLIMVADSGSQRVTVTEEGSRVVVFGASLAGAHVEAFDVKDGKNLFRFTTAY
jgi:hypothetical protein